MSKSTDTKIADEIRKFNEKIIKLAGNRSAWINVKVVTKNYTTESKTKEKLADFRKRLGIKR